MIWDDQPGTVAPDRRCRKERFGEPGLFGTAAILGLVDMDALTISMAQLTAGGTAADLTARAVAIGVFVNTLVKLTMTVVIGRGAFRTLTALGLALMAVALMTSGVILRFP